jgi:hypothetical protein
MNITFDQGKRASEKSSEGGMLHFLGRLAESRGELELASAARSVGDTVSARRNLEDVFALLNHRQWIDLQIDCAVLLLELALDDRDIGLAEKWRQEAILLAVDAERLAVLEEKLDELKSDSRV